MFVKSNDYLKMIILLSTIFCVSAEAMQYKEKVATDTNDWTVQTQAKGLLRYENESFNFRNDRERLRFIGNFAVKLTHDKWTYQMRASTGLRNRQNVPAITIAKFNQQTQPDSDVFVDQFYLSYASERLGSITIGKQPWPLKNVTDTFWDRHLHPIGITWQSSDLPLTMSYLKPLDGEGATVGNMWLVQGHFAYSINANTKLHIHPWWVEYHGQAARFATRDTAFDHSSIRLSTWLQHQAWKVGFDWGNNSQAPDESYGDTSWALQLTYGNLKKVGNAQWHARYVNAEKYGVITEFAQNAVAGFSTSNIKGFDFRYRYKVRPNVWLGTRYSDIESITQSVREGKRFRIEAGFTM